MSTFQKLVVCMKLISMISEILLDLCFFIYLPTVLAYRIDVYGIAVFRFKSVIACIFAIYIVVLNIALWLSSV